MLIEPLKEKATNLHWWLFYSILEQGNLEYSLSWQVTAMTLVAVTGGQSFTD
ncbi:hypothetical protein HG534_11665 [Moraxella osloensis]|nr:hypothetical protein [Moraxella osloensis]MBW4016945.1 hypothetical protein [Moraxella osloensis]MBW4019164.1 hypothetical protein [Moraxella osloensis]VWX31821.1 hypothetical protein ENHY17A_600033 [Moraxellaceae bacterium 17A]